MTAAGCAEQTEAVPLKAVERELTRLRKALAGPGEAPVLRAHLSNLVIFCRGAASAMRMADEVPAIVAVHPARVLMLVVGDSVETDEIQASICVRVQRTATGTPLSSEQITLRAAGSMIDRMPFVARSLVIGDLPINVWWAVAQPPSDGGAFLFDLIDHAEQVIYDSVGWTDPPRGVVGTATWLERVEGDRGHGRRRTVSDLNWRRLKFWRRLLAQAIDPQTAPGIVESLSDLLVEHGPHGVIQAWELASWLTSRLGWRVAAGRAHAGKEITWQFKDGARVLRVRVRRLDEGPAEVRHVRLAWGRDGLAGALNLTLQEEYRLAALPENESAKPRTLIVPPQPLAEVLGRQLSDRERDPIFLQSMAVARELAQSLLA